MSFAVGVALSCRLKGFQNHIYVILGDGECNEGIIWEALMSVSNYKLANLTVIVDQNNLQVDGFTDTVMNMGSLTDKFTSFGFNTIEIDGHSITDLLKAFNNKDQNRPNAIIANTIKGKGISFMENKYNWHHNVLNETRYNKAVSELNRE